jgi:hypothetical protein
VDRPHERAPAPAQNPVTAGAGHPVVAPRRYVLLERLGQRLSR